MAKKNIPFDFIFDYLIPIDVKIRPMFGFWAIYLNDKIMLILKQHSKNPESNGIWVATSQKHHASLKRDIPSLRPVSSEETEWQLIPEDSSGFETSARLLCEFIVNNDYRIGRIPKPKKSKD